jgi:hypothetical protein
MTRAEVYVFQFSPDPAFFKRICSIHVSGVDAKFSRDGKWIVVALADYTYMLYDYIGRFELSFPLECLILLGWEDLLLIGEEQMKDHQTVLDLCL